jgi:lipoprotein-anchoring transpeptidase ErfK/SrfK
MKRAAGWFLATIILVLVNPLVAQTAKSNDSARAPWTVLVSIPDRKLVVLVNGIVVAGFPISVGADRSPSPIGEFTIMNRVSNPIYYHEGVMIPAGRGNPVGTRWVGLSRKGYGIHGTNAPKSIGRAASHGCIRLRNRDMEQLFGMLHVGDVVKIRGERDEQIAEIFGGEVDRESEAVAEVTAEAVGARTVSSF